jgi:hypothetical protein
MRAVVILYDGEKLSESCQSTIGEMVLKNVKGTKLTISTLNDEEVEKCTTMSVTKVVVESKNQGEDDVFKKAIEILGNALKGDSEIEVAAKLLEAKMNLSTPPSERDAIKNAITVIGEYSLPAILVTKYGMTIHSVMACRALCKSGIL